MRYRTNHKDVEATHKESWRGRLPLFLTPWDARFEEYKTPAWKLILLRDLSAGLIVAMMAIPMAMGFAMASGLRPEHGIVGGAIAGLIGALFGGSKYQVYGPTAAFIPLIAGLMAVYTERFEFETAHGFLALCSLLAGVILLAMGLFGVGKIVNLVPHSIVVGFTIGIAVTIATSQIGEVLGLPIRGRLGFWSTLKVAWQHLGEFNGDAVLIALITFLSTKYLLKISIYIPAPLVAIAIAIALARVLADGPTLATVHSKYGAIPTNFLVFTPPVMPEWSLTVFKDILYTVVVIVFVSALESLLCSRMADRLAENRGTPFNPNKEFWGQGLVQIIVPLCNGFPHTGALARTATNIKVGAVTPLAGIAKGILKLILAFVLATFLELVPMACIGGILMWVAANMVKPTEIKQVLAHNRFHVALMVYTAGMVMFTDFLTGVVTALVIYAALWRFLDTPSVPAHLHDIAGENVVELGIKPVPSEQEVPANQPLRHR